MSPKKSKAKKPKIIHSWGPSLLKPLIKQRGLTQAGVGKSLAELDRQRTGQSMTADEIDDQNLKFEQKVNQWTRGKVEHPRGPIMADLCKILNVDIGYFDRESSMVSVPNFGSNEGASRRSDFKITSPIAISPSSIPIRGRSMAGKEGALVFSPGDVIGMVDAPADIATVPDAYAVYVTGESMAPVYRPGHVLIINPYLPPNPQDDVVIQISRDNGATIEGFVKRYVGADEKHVKVSQFNPPQTIRFPVAQVIAVHSVVYSKRR